MNTRTITSDVCKWLQLSLRSKAVFSVIDRLLLTETQRAIHYEWSSEKEAWIEWNWRRPGRVLHITAHLTETRDRIALVMSYKEQWMSTLSPSVVHGYGVRQSWFLLHHWLWFISMFIGWLCYTIFITKMMFTVGILNSLQDQMRKEIEEVVGWPATYVLVWTWTDVNVLWFLSQNRGGHIEKRSGCWYLLHSYDLH